METLKIYKVGGHVIDFPDRFEMFLENFARQEGLRILVHGGGAKATRIARQLHVKSEMVDGRRITGHDLLDIVTMVYGGLNKQITARLESYELDALGMSGADLGIIPAHRRVHPTIDYGYVGDIRIEDIRSKALSNLMRIGVTPVFCSLTLEKKTGTLLNTNADTIATSIAIAMTEHYNVELIFVFEQKGILRRLGDPNSVIPEIRVSNISELAQKHIVSGGMLPKLTNARDAVIAGIEQVRLTSFADLNSGTIVRK